MFRLAPSKSERNKAVSDWAIGVFAGIESISSEYLFLNTNGLFKCRTMKKLPRDRAFNPECFTEITFDIGGYIEKGARTTVEGRQGELAPEGEQGNRAFAPRRVRLIPEDFRKNGFTVDCRGCIYFQDGVGTRAAHSEECRRRLEEAMKSSPEGQERNVRAHARQNQWVATDIEKNEEVIDDDDGLKGDDDAIDIELDDLDDKSHSESAENIQAAASG